MPSLVAPTFALQRKPFVRTHYVRTKKKNNAKFSGHYVCPRTNYAKFSGHYVCPRTQTFVRTHFVRTNSFCGCARAGKISDTI